MLHLGSYHWQKAQDLEIMAGVMGNCKMLQSRLLTIWREEQLFSLATYKLAKRLVEQNIRLFRRRLTQEELQRVGADQPYSKNEKRMNGIFFFCKEPSGPYHSCLSDMKEMAEVEWEDIPSNFQDENPSFDESMGSYEDAFEEH